MEIDELKDETKKIKAPDVASLDFGDRVRTVNGLADELKRRDAAEKKRLRRFMIVFGVIGVGLIAVALRGDPDPGVRLGRWLLASIYALVVALSAIKSFTLGKVDYAEPALPFLKKAVKRYRFIAPWEYYIMVPGLGVAGLAGWLLAASGFDHIVHRARATTFDILYVLGFIGLCAFGLIMSRRDWKRDKGPLHDRLVSLLKDFSEDV
jgi:hypothetical protein